MKRNRTAGAFQSTTCDDCGKQSGMLLEMSEYAGLVQGATTVLHEDGSVTVRKCPVPHFVNERSVCYSCYRKAVRAYIKEFKNKH